MTPFFLRFCSSRCKKRSLAWKMKERREGDVRTHYLHWLYMYSTDCTRGYVFVHGMYVRCTMCSTCSVVSTERSPSLFTWRPAPTVPSNFEERYGDIYHNYKLEGRWMNYPSTYDYHYQLLQFYYFHIFLLSFTISIIFYKVPFRVT